MDKNGISHSIVLTKKHEPIGVSWKCDLTSNGEFQVKALRKKLENHEPMDT